MFNENFPDWSYKINILRYVRSANIRKESYAVLGPLPKIHCEKNEKTGQKRDQKLFNAYFSSLLSL